MFSYSCVITLPDDCVESQYDLDIKAAKQAFAEALSRGHIPCYVRRIGHGGMANRLIAHSGWSTEANTSSFANDAKFSDVSDAAPILKD